MILWVMALCTGCIRRIAPLQRISLVRVNRNADLFGANLTP